MSEFEKRIKVLKRFNEGYYDKECTDLPISAFRLWLKKAKQEFPCKPCMDLDDTHSKCQRELITWFVKWFGE